MRLIFLILLLVLVQDSYAQHYDSKWLLAYTPSSWIEEQCIQIDFSINPPKIGLKKTPIDYKDNSITMSNENGEIIFTTNGCDYLSGDDDIILSYDSLDLGYGKKYCGGGNITTQNVINLPFPNEHLFLSVYKDFILDTPEIKLISTKLQSITLKESNDSITIEAYNSLMLFDTLTTGTLSSTKHTNLKDWWIINWRANSNNYISTLIKADTFYNNNPIALGDTINEKGDGVGQAVFSPDGTKYAFTNIEQGVFIFDFDRSTGQLSNYSRVPLQKTNLIKTFGCAFSSNGRFLYVCGRTVIYQIDTWVPNEDLVAEVVGEYEGILEQCGFLPPTYFKAQLAPDCRIYMSGTNGISCLHVINHPNLKGKACEVVNGALAFPPKIYNAYTIPNHPNYRLGIGEVCDSTLLFPVATKEPTIKLTKEEILIYPNPSSEIINMAFPDKIDIPDEIFIYSISGVLVEKIKISNTGSDHDLKLDISSVEKGMYFLKWIDKETGRSYIVKFIKE